MGDFPYTDVSAQYPCGPLDGGLIDIESQAKSLVEQNVVPLKAGDGSPAGNGDARGLLGEPVHFRRGVDLDGTIFDCRGLVSITILGWCRVSTLTMQPFFWSVYDAANANGQAWVLNVNTTGGPGNQVPRMIMYDGLTIFNLKLIKVSVTAPSMTLDKWHMIGGSWNKITNKLACFWGDGNDGTGATTYYAETDGFAAGFGFTNDYQQNNCGRFRAGGAVENNWDVDHVSYWKGRAFNEDDFLNHWQGGAGLKRSEFAEDPGGSAGPTVPVGDMYYYRR